MTVQLLNEYERGRLDDLGGTAWLTSKSPSRALNRRQLKKAVERLIHAQQAVKAPHPAEPRILAQLLGVMMQNHGVIRGHFKKRNPEELKDETAYNRFFYWLAAAYIERWFREQKEPSEPPEVRPFYLPDDYIDSVGDVLQLARELGQQGGEEAKAEMPKGEWFEPPPEDPDGVLAAARDEIVALLMSHVDFSREVVDGQIPVAEQEREIEVAALLNLRMEDLRELAQERGVPIISSKEGLAELIARDQEITREEIAEWALRRGESAIDHGLVTRLVPLREVADVAAARAELERLVGTYARVKTARWFVFEEVGGTEGFLRLKGRLKSYRTKPVLDTDSFKLNATPHEAEIRLRLREKGTWAEIDARTVTDARDMRIVLARGALAPTEPRIDMPLDPLEGDIAVWDPLTIWMLAFLELHLVDANISFHNFRMAHFERSGPAAAPDRPQIDEVQLRGQHVGDHRDSCQLIIDARRLLDVEVAVRFAPTQSESYIIPIRIGIAADHATVMTAAARDVPSPVTSELHRVLVDKLRRALDNKVDASALDKLVNDIAERARQQEPAEHADLFAPEVEIEASASEPEATAAADA